MNETDGYIGLINESEVLPGMKRCNGPCKLVKKIEDFAKRKDAKDGRRNMCNTCRNEYVTNWKENPPVKRVIPEGMKHCPGCDLIKAKGEFGKKRRRPDGLQCKSFHCIGKYLLTFVYF
jgi:hypothetical protein